MKSFTLSIGKAVCDARSLACSVLLAMGIDEESPCVNTPMKKSRIELTGLPLYPASCCSSSAD